MRILITGNMGYVGPTVVRRLRGAYPHAHLVGLDMGYFANCLTNSAIFPECRADIQYFGDVRKCSSKILDGTDVVVYLAAISNDPMGALFEDITLDINYRAAVQLAERAKELGTCTFIYASSCSVYGCAEEGARTEESHVNPLTAYARSKVFAEAELAKLADHSFTVSCLRFATACGMSERLRLDLVLNDFVASALVNGRITILSDGTPWRPLIHIKDMAKAIEWAVQRKSSSDDRFLAVNVGADSWNYQIRELAHAVSKVIPNVAIEINKNAQPDKRSYRVSFEKYKRLAPDHQPSVDLIAAVEELSDGLKMMQFQDQNFRSSSLVRLNVLKSLCEKGYLTDNLEWSLASMTF